MSRCLSNKLTRKHFSGDSFPRHMGPHMWARRPNLNGLHVIQHPKFRQNNMGRVGRLTFLGVSKKSKREKLEELTMQLESGGQQGDSTGYGRWSEHVHARGWRCTADIPCTIIYHRVVDCWWFIIVALIAVVVVFGFFVLSTWWWWFLAVM